MRQVEHLYERYVTCKSNHASNKIVSTGTQLTRGAFDGDSTHHQSYKNVSCDKWWQVYKKIMAFTVFLR